MDPAIVKKLAEAPPKVHDEYGEVVSWRLETAALHFIDAVADRRARTLVVGVGASTILLGDRGCRHVAITPYEAEVVRSREYAAAYGFSLATVEFLEGRLQDILPVLAQRNFDLAVIDGDHAFPVPIVDWLYTAERLRVGGVFLVDDVQIWTGRLLRSFLIEEPCWQLEWEESRAFAFRKTAEPVVHPWTEQPFVARRSLVWGASGWAPVHAAVGSA